MTYTIVVGYDGSEPSKKALDAALDLAKEKQAQVLLTCGYQVPLRNFGSWHAIDDLEEAVAAGVQEAITGCGADACVVLEAVVLPLRPTAAILTIAEERDADLIVVGSRGESGIAGSLAGSTVQGLVHHTKTPLLIIPV
jgi:nucleotide-binding universal stress UspA family protein